MRELGAQDPQLVGPYRLLGRLGTGGMGQVYLARSDGGRTVAVKLIRPEMADNPEFRARFRREVTVARSVCGRWTAPVLDADPDAAVPWVATGYVAGPSLHDVVGRWHGALPEPSLFALANGLVRALSDIHAAGLVHRDLKPSNVLVTIDGPRIIDFGIARAVEVETAAWHTATGSVVGSPGFMPPEQLRGEQVTPAGDVFSLGAVLAFAATARPPFGDPASGVHAMMLRVLQNDKDLSDVPERMAALVEHCLAPAAADRPGLAELVRLTAEGDVWDGGSTTEPWLPATVIARLGRHAVELLDSEAPNGDRRGAPRPGKAPHPGDAAPQPASTPEPLATAASDAPPSASEQGTPPVPALTAGTRRGPRRRIAVTAAAAAVALVIGIGTWAALDKDDGGPTANAGNGSPTPAASEPRTSGGTAATDTGTVPAVGDRAAPAPGDPAPSTTSAPVTRGMADVAGIWEGTSQRIGEANTTHHRFELTDGKVGDRVGKVWAVYPHALCVAHVVPAAVEDDHVTVSTEKAYDVPDGACTFTGVSTLGKTGSTLYWKDSGLTAALQRAADRAEPEAVPEAFLGARRQTDPTGARHVLTLVQGNVTSALLSWSVRGPDGSRCAWTHTLMAVGPQGEWLLFGPADDATSEPAGACADGGRHSLLIQAPTADRPELTIRELPEGQGTWEFSSRT
ncbi:protein kinase domain-containing protein [Yinghuangia sp. YIM S09857]|uniref:serine/threonine-protein kinase n=1 Tax=Yinghuangia sp. YIM S09857 TaxID=3436929 RepID=UPI003F52C781